MAALIQPITNTHASRGSAASDFLKRELASSPERFNFAVRATICAVTITLIGETGRSEALFLALFISLSVPRAYPKQTFRAAVILVIAIVLSSIAALFLQVLVADLPWARVLMIFTSTFFAMLIGRKLNQPLAGALISVMLTEPLLVYDNFSNTETVVEGVLWFVLMFAFGLFTATVIEYLFPHPTTLQRLTNGIDQQLKTVSAIFKQISGESLTEEEQKQASTVNRLAMVGTAPLRQALNDARSAHLLSGKDFLRLSSVLPGLELLGDLAAQLSRYTAGELDARQRNFAAKLSQQTSRLAERLNLLLLTPEREKSEALALNGQSGSTPDLLLSQSSEVLEALWKSWYLDSEFPADTVQPRVKPPKRSSISLQPFFARDNVRFALKVSLATIVCYILYNAVDWPGISTALVTCYVTALDTIGATYRKLALRLAGVAIGGLLFGIGGISLFLSNMDNVVELSLYVAVVFFVAGWIVNGSQRISYAGVQIGLSFALVAMSSPTIPVQIQEARDRFLGVLLGAVVMWFVFRYLWPVDMVTEQRFKLAELMEAVAQLFQLAINDCSKQERVTRLNEIRDSASQTISTANDQADAAGYNARNDTTLRQSLRDCLTKTQALLRLAIIEAELSIDRAIGEPGHNANREKLAGEYAGFLDALAGTVKTGNLDQLDGLARQMGALQAEAESMIPDISPEQVRDDERSRDTQAFDRLARQRPKDVAELFRTVKNLLAHHDSSIAAEKS